VFVRDQRERMEPAAGSAREDYTFHCCRDSTCGYRSRTWGTLCFAAMVGQSGPPLPAPQTRFSADGFWWWDGAEWKPALSQDRLWRWTGQGWVPARQAAGAGQAVGLTIGLMAGFVGILVLVSIVVIVILLTMGNQIANVFSNVISALG
jgi:hypothetical protein